MARFGHIVDDAGEVLDEAVVTYFAAPHSYTSEDVVEIAAHGAPVLLEYLLRAAIAHGARLAEPGEFTQRAFLSGRLDLTQAEAVNDLIQAQTLHQAKTAAAQVGGALSRQIAPLKHSLLELMAALEAGVDFAEDDLDLMPQPEIVDRIAGLHNALAELARTYAYGRMLREGVKLAIVGRPNAGKSSLFNRLLERERAIVTAQPGTTRDPISEQLAIGGIPVDLIDTAGLREIAATPETEAEREGIARSRSTMAEADLVLHVVEASSAGELSEGDRELQETLRGRASLLVWSKCDLDGSAGSGEADPSVALPNDDKALPTSAKTGQGLSELKQAILAILQAQPPGDSAVVTNLRQAQAIQSATAALAKAGEAAAQDVPHEFLLLDLQEALGALDGLTGASTPDDVLNLIFSSFCIGK
jgi:tRNA modification GTPase